MDIKTAVPVLAELYAILSPKERLHVQESAKIIRRKLLPHAYRMRGLLVGDIDFLNVEIRKLEDQLRKAEAEERQKEIDKAAQEKTTLPG